MTNLDYWQTLVGEQNPEDFLRTYGTADPDVGLERFLEDRGHFYGVLNQGDWATTFTAERQCHVLTARVYLRSYLEETREDWQPALEARPPKVVRRYKPVYDLPATDSKESDSKSDIEAPAAAAEETVAPEAPAPDEAPEVSAPDEAIEAVEVTEETDPSTDPTTTPEDTEVEAPPAAPSEEAVVDNQAPPPAEAIPDEAESTPAPEAEPTETQDLPAPETTTPDTQGS